MARGLFAMDKILKFGGSSVGSPERIKNTLKIIKKAYDDSPHIAVVVSAFGGVTDRLISLGKMAAAGKNAYQKVMDEAISIHIHAAEELVPSKRLNSALEFLESNFQELRNLLEGVFLIKELSPKTSDLIMSFGERLSAFIIAEAIQPIISEAKFLDARAVIKTDRMFGGARVDFEETNQNIEKFFHDFPCMPIITGFIASTKENETSILGRGGSDYTAAIFGAALNVNVIEIWTDVSGVFTADPRKEPYAFPIAKMSYKEAMEMSYFGAKVIHPPTIVPAFEKKIPLLIKNTFEPKAPGTLISAQGSKSDSLVTGISSIDDVALLCLQGAGMVGVCGISKRLFGALAARGLSAILISQGSSEHSICFAVASSAVDLAKDAIQKEFSLEINANLIDKLVIESNLSVIAVVGENMCKKPGIAGKLFGALGKNGVNVMAIAQGSSELNISVVVQKQDEVKAIKVIHEAFFLSPRKTLNVFLVGSGLIGGTLLNRMRKRAQSLPEEHSLDIRLIGLANSRHMVFDREGIPLEEWDQILQRATEKMDVEAFVDRMKQFNTINAVFVDCTSSQVVTNAYELILKSNISIVTPNKKANSGRYKNYKKLKELTLQRGVNFLYGSNVGAGLPMISAINELVRSGDEILKIEAILSGTLSYLFNSFIEGKSFSEVVHEAAEKGYTEPDPREDLNGMDVARKILILSRESGFPLEMEDICIESILPEDCFNEPSLHGFYAKLKSYDDQLEVMRKKAAKEGKVLRYIATFEKGKASLSLTAVGPQHPFYHLSGSENIIAITSQFYLKNPLVIKGPGAGAEVTAGKVFADIIRLGLD